MQAVEPGIIAWPSFQRYPRHGARCGWVVRGLNMSSLDRFLRERDHTYEFAMFCSRKAYQHFQLPRQALCVALRSALFHGNRPDFVPADENDPGKHVLKAIAPESGNIMILRRLIFGALNFER